MDDVQPYTASGNVRDLFRHRETWQEDQPDQFLVAHGIQMRPITESHGQRFVFDLVRVDTSPIVRDLNDDLSGFMPGAERQGSLHRFASLLARRWSFNPMIDPIADQMHQWITNRFNDGFIQFHLLTLDHQRDLLAQFLGQITHHTLKLMEHIAKRLHTRRHNGFLEFRGNEIDPLRGDFDGWRIARCDGSQ